MATKYQWDFRRPMEEDLAFIYSTWLHSYQGDSYFCNFIKKSVYHRNYPGIVDTILLRAGTLVACKLKDPMVIYGYLVFEPNVAHYCFVKEAFRFGGIAKSLFETAFGKSPWLQFTHKTRTIEPILNKYSELTYNPFLLFEKNVPRGTEKGKK